MELSLTALGVISVMLLGLALVAPAHAVFLSEFPLVAVQGNWEIFGVLLNPTDLVLVALALSLVFHRSRISSEVWSFRRWLLLGVLMSVAYAMAPVSQPYLTDPIRIVYQLYRYAWKLILYFPLTVLLLGGRNRVRLAITGLIVGADLLSVSAISQGLAGYQATGPFTSWNQLGGVLLGPLLFCVGRTFSPKSRGDLIFSAGSLLLIARALLYTGSRGSIGSFAVGFGFFIGWLWLIPESRQRLLRLVPVAVLGLVLVMVMVPDVTRRPNIQRALTIRSPTEVGTFQWRISERWPHFWQKTVENPWFGVGTDVDPSLGSWANTPHNGYLSLAMLYGIPVALLYLGFALRAIWQGILVFRHRSDPWLRMTGLNVSAVLVALLTHNVVDSTLVATFVGNQFWMLCGLAVLLFRWQKQTTTTERPTQVSSATDRQRVNN